MDRDYRFRKSAIGRVGTSGSCLVEQTHAAEAGVAAPGYDDVIVQDDPQALQRITYDLGHLDVWFRWSGVIARVIMNHDDR